MKAFVHISLIAACLIACAHGLPSARRDSAEDFDSMEIPNLFAETINRLRQNFFNYFWNTPEITSFNIPEGANTTSTTKIINGHVVTVNETTYTSGDENGGTAFRIRIIDVKPQNENDITTKIGDDSTPKTPSESAETIEDFNNEISKNGGDQLTA